MIYRVLVDYLFTIKDEALDFFHDCEVTLPKTAAPDPDSELHESSSASIHECHHDAQPALQCDLMRMIKR